MTVERAAASDAAEIAALFLASRADELPWLARVHDDDEVRGWVRSVLLRRGRTWVAREDGVIVGFLTLDGDHIDHLYLRPGHYRRGIGSQLLAEAKAKSSERLLLYCFQRNARARAFYEHHGFRVVTMSDGAGNEEREPDILYEWLG